MSQPSSTKSSPHPVLQTALSSLDVQLEVELVQYRCHQTVRHSPPPLAYRVSQNQVDETSSDPLAATGSVTAIPLPRHTHLHLNNSVCNGTTSVTPSNDPQVDEMLESAYSLTLEDYLEFSQAYWKGSEESQASTKFRFLQRLCSPLAIGAAVSLFLSIPLSYVIILYLASVIGVGSDTCLLPQPPKPFYFCNGSSTSGDR